MRKLLFTISVIGYLIVTCGLVVNAHYCMNRLNAVALFSTHEDVCGKCGMSMEDAGDCCHDEQQVIQLVQDQQLTNLASWNDHSPKMPVAELPEFLLAFTQDEASFITTINHSPPIIPEQDICIKNRVFRI